jgi:hypothetical protein
MHKRGINQSWNKAYGIDPEIPVREEDRKAIEGNRFAFADDRPGRRMGTEIQPPFWIHIVAR